MKQVTPSASSAASVITGEFRVGVIVVPLNGAGFRSDTWSAPASLDTGTLIGYTAIASPGGAARTTTGATTCTITGLVNGTSYSAAVVAHTTVGDSGASAPASVTPGGNPAFTSVATNTVACGTGFSFTVTATGPRHRRSPNPGRCRPA
jgi:hypothetical protein